jgi:hypothetical protein
MEDRLCGGYALWKGFEHATLEWQTGNKVVDIPNSSKLRRLVVLCDGAGSAEVLRLKLGLFSVYFCAEVSR